MRSELGVEVSFDQVSGGLQGPRACRGFDPRTRPDCVARTRSPGRPALGMAEPEKPMRAQQHEHEEEEAAMAETPRRAPLRAGRSLKAPLGAAATAVDWATLALLGVATVALAISTRLPSRRRPKAAPAARPPKT